MPGRLRALTLPEQAAVNSSPRHRATSCTLGSNLPRGRGLPAVPKSWKRSREHQAMRRFLHLALLFPQSFSSQSRGSPPRAVGRGGPALTAPALLWLRRRWRSCTRCSCCWYHSRPRAIISKPCSSTSCSWSNSFICFNYNTRAHRNIRIPASRLALCIPAHACVLLDLCTGRPAHRHKYHISHRHTYSLQRRPGMH